MTSTTTPRTAQTARRNGAGHGGKPGPFPVIIVRPATVTLPSYLREQRRRQRSANQLAAELTEQCRIDRHRFVDQIGVDLDHPYDYELWFRDRQVVCHIIRQARALATAPPPGAVRIGRDRRARPAVAVLHGPQWSLVLRRACPYPAAWVLVGTSELCLRLYGTRELSVEWDEMTRDVYTTLTGDTG
jgi:hypothetical protein